LSTRVRSPNSHETWRDSRVRIRRLARREAAQPNDATARSERPPPPPPTTPKPANGSGAGGATGHSSGKPPTPARLLDMYQHGVGLLSARRHASSDQGAQGAARRTRSAKSLPTAMMSSDAECTFAPKLATGSTLPSQVRAAPSSSDRRSIGWLLRPCGFERRPTPRRARATPT